MKISFWGHSQNFTDTILGHSQNFTDTVWIVGALGQGLIVFVCFVEWTPTFLFLPDCSALAVCNVWYAFIYFRDVSKPFWNYLSLCSRRSWKKRQKFGDVVKDIFPSQWFFHALYKKTGRRDMRRPRSNFLWNWLAHMTQIVRH